jgi:hypothetical protein
MDPKNEMTRKQFLVLTFSLVGTAAATKACDDDDDNSQTPGTAGTSGGGTSGGGTGGRGGGGGTAGTAGQGGTTGTGGGVQAGCTDPLPSSQLADSTGHTHSVMIAASTLNATTAQTFDTTLAAGHMHAVTLEPADLTTLKNGGTVTKTSSVTDLHAHMYMVRCT